jgi:hypothetical protein
MSLARTACPNTVLENYARGLSARFQMLKYENYGNLPPSCTFTFGDAEFLYIRHHSAVLI